MRKIYIFGPLFAVLLAGCAVTPPPAPRPLPPDPVSTNGQNPSFIAAQPTPAQRPKATGTLADAQHHMIRGMAAIEMAKSESELVLAEDEFRSATEIAPQLANAWFNLAKTQSQLKKYGEAIDSYRQYLAYYPEEVIYGPLGKGGLGVAPYGLQSWWDGGFSVVQMGWQGRLGVRVKPNTPAYAAGLRDMDEVLAIDGVPVKSLSAGQAVVRLRGEPGSLVTLEL